MNRLNKILEQIKNVEGLSRKLEPSTDERAGISEAVTAYTEEFLKGIYSTKAFNETAKKGAGLYDTPISDEPTSIQEILQLYEEHVNYPGLNPASGGHLGYIPGGGVFPAALGDFLADVTNKYAGIFFASPGAVRMENMMIRWMCDIIGYTDEAGGNLSSGGSIANLIGIVTGRDAFKIKAREYENIVIYLTRQVHHSVNKAIRIAGLQESFLRYIDVDEHFRMDAAALKNQIELDLKSGLKPFMVIASVGTTDTGAVDPVDQIAEITQQYNLWLHVDGAYGGFFVLTEEGKQLIKGLEKADSVVMDPHKTLFLPYGSGALLVKNKQHLLNSQYYKANYMQDALSANEEESPADLSPELTKHFRGVRMWLPLKLFGLKPFKAALREKIWLTRYFYEEIRQKPNFETGPYPDLSIMIFRYVPEEGNANAFNAQLVQAIQKDGRLFMSSTTINNKFYIRLAVVSFRTHLDTIELALKVIDECVEKVKGSVKTMV